MHWDHKIFVEGLRDSRRILLTYETVSDGFRYTRWCAPMSFCRDPFNSSCEYYNFWDFEDEASDHRLALSDDQIVSMKITEFEFDEHEFSMLEDAVVKAAGEFAVCS